MPRRKQPKPLKLEPPVERQTIMQRFGDIKNQTLARRAQVTELLKLDFTQEEIAKQCGVDRTIISRDIAAIRAAWEHTAILNFDAAVKAQLEKISIIEEEAWDAWEKSKQPRTTYRASKQDSEEKGITTKKERIKVESIGDAVWLDRIAWCVEQRARIYGMYKNQTVEQHNHIGQQNVIVSNVDGMQDLFKLMARREKDMIVESTAVPAK